MDAADGVVKGKGNKADGDRVLGCPQPWEGAGEGVWWVRSWYCEHEWGGFGEGDSKVLSIDAVVNLL